MGPVKLEVLFVEDSENDVEFVARALRKSGFAPAWERVETATALREALERKPWQLVISDSSMPQLSALDALALTKQVSPELPFIVVSGTMTEEVAVQVIREGAADFITKGRLERLGASVARELEPSRRAAARELSKRLLAAQEAERRRVARTLHDQLGQLLTALELSLKSARKGTGAARDKELQHALKLLKQALAQTRDLSVELWPTVLDDLGLASALRGLVDRRVKWAGADVLLDAAAGRFTFEVETAAFRIAQEALTNVARHALAKHVSIGLRVAGEVLELDIRDDGTGFDVERAWQRANAGASLGLLGMRERASLAGGLLEIESEPGKGTWVRVRLPAATRG